MTSPSSVSPPAWMRPFSSAGSRSPASLIADGRESTTIGSALRTVVSSISRRSSELEPAAFTCVPGAIHSPSNTGVAAVVMVTTMSLPFTASSARRRGHHGESRAARPCARRTARPSRRARVAPSRCSSLRTWASASSCPRACHPEPKMPATFASGRASQRAATPPGGARAHHAEVVRLDDSREAAALGVEDVDQEAHALAARGVRLVAEHARRRHRALQDVQRRLRQARALARDVDRLAGGVLAMDALDELEGAWTS